MEAVGDRTHKAAVKDFLARHARPDRFDRGELRLEHHVINLA